MQKPNPRQMHRFLAFQSMDNDRIDSIINQSDLCVFQPSDVILEKNHKNDRDYYLLQGVIEYKTSFFSHKQLSADAHDAVYPVNKVIPEKCQICANSTCHILVVDPALLEQSPVPENPPARAYTPDNYLVRSFDHVEHMDDWLDKILSSPLFHCVKPTNIPKLLAALEAFPVKAGQVIIEAGKKDDFFYIVRQGEAQVLLASAKPDDRLVKLRCGDFFGDTSLIAGTPHSATVQMLCDGILMRATKEIFDEIIRSSTLRRIDAGDAVKLQADDSVVIVVVDVRLPMEYKGNHWPDSVNIPIGRLRDHLVEFSKDVVYFVAPGEDKRSELAVHIMNEHGVDAYLVMGTNGHPAKFR